MSTPPEASRAPHSPRRITRLRWWIVWTLFGSTVINYISRQTFSVLAPAITTQFHLTPYRPYPYLRRLPGFLCAHLVPRGNPSRYRRHAHRARHRRGLLVHGECMHGP